MRFSISVLVLLAFTVFGDSCTVFETSFADLPDGWSNDEWNFSSNDGAWISGWVTGWPSFNATMGSDDSYQGWFLVPHGTDSLKIHILNELDALNSGYCQAGIELLIPGFDELYLFGPSIPWGMHETSDPINITLHTPPAGGWIGFNLSAIWSDPRVTSTWSNSKTLNQFFRPANDKSRTRLFRDGVCQIGLVAGTLEARSRSSRIEIYPLTDFL